jgi:Domain of unknown function (DUF4424)
LGAVWVIVLLAVGPGWANDSEAELAVGGLALKQSDDVSLDSEDLYISADEVRVGYRFTNHSATDVNTLVAFPLPDQVYVEDTDNFYRDMVKDLSFKTQVDGKAVDYRAVVQPIFAEQDITGKLKAAGLPMNGLQDTDAFSNKVAGLPEATRKALLAEGLLGTARYGDAPFYWAKWALRTSITRQQVFPAGKTVVVKHRYKPLAGGSVGGGLSKEARKDDWGKQKIARYCIEDDWFASFDRAVAKRATKDNAAPYGEVWLGYVLKSGSNWKGTIKDFRMVVDKGKAENLLSFCAEGVKKISPTQFEVKKTDFEPKDDLNFLIVTWWRPE